MKAALYKGPRDVEIIDKPKPVPGPGQAVVKVVYVGICGTDVHSYMHPGIISPPTIFGHETVGTIDSLGEGVTGFKVGDRVAVGPPGNCGECHNCLSGRSSICIHGFPLTTGITPNTDGGYAEYMLVRNPKKMCIPVPAGMSMEEAVLFDVMGTSFHGIRYSRFKMGDSVAVLGTGPIGFSAMMLLKLGGASKVIALVRSEEKAKLSLEYGADIAIDITKVQGEALVEKVRSLTGGKGVDVSYECAGGAEPTQTCLSVTRSGGQVLLIGMSPEPLGVRTAFYGPTEIDLQITFVYDAAEIAMIFDFLASGKLPQAKKMVTDIIGMNDVVTKGLERLSRKNDQIKILLAPNGPNGKV
jgi:threonine dehydrogenase-like Zn-dependent dehydrogenase